MKPRKSGSEHKDPWHGPRPGSNAWIEAQKQRSRDTEEDVDDESLDLENEDLSQLDVLERHAVIYQRTLKGTEKEK